MRRVLIFGLAMTLSVWPQTFRTGDPLTIAGRGTPPLTPPEYEKFAASVKGKANIVVVAKLPPNLSPAYRLGYNFVYEHVNHGWILDHDSIGYVLYVDRKGDGDLSAAEPLRFHEEGGVPRLDVAMQDSEARWTTRVEIAKERSSAGGAEQTTVRMSSSASRKGVIEVDGHRFPFQLSGSAGRYYGVTFDREGNGKFDSYKPTDRWVNLAGKTYEFKFDPLGAFLTLREIESRADRLSLKNGTPLPDVSLTDLDGKNHSLRNGSSDLTLIEFWNTSCGPCRQEMPLLKKLFDQLPRARFNILAVTSDESIQTLRKYLTELSITWPECLEPDDGPIHQTMRIESIPAYFLVAKNGEIVDQWVGAGDSVKRIETAIDLLLPKNR